ncbi:MAG: hypothetical protein ACRDTH_25375 [Pseudonocardiaceae bacterium]
MLGRGFVTPEVSDLAGGGGLLEVDQASGQGGAGGTQRRDPRRRVVYGFGVGDGVRSRWR